MEQVIKDIRAKIIGQHRSLYNKNEAQVRRQLIEPILDALGWRTDDPDLVQINAPSEERDIPDYTLLKSERVETFVEAKNLSANILDHIPQLGRYCYNRGKEFGILTNGNDWLVIKAFERDTSPKDRVVWQISLENDNLSIIKSKLTTISKANITTLSDVIEKEKVLERFWFELTKNDENITNVITNIVVKEFLKENRGLSLDETVVGFLSDKIASAFKDNSNASNIEPDTIPIQNPPFKIQKRDFAVKAPSPSAFEWSSRVADLKHVPGLNNWKRICDYLSIEVGSNSARRALDSWVKLNKPNWPQVPEV